MLMRVSSPFFHGHKIPYTLNRPSSHDDENLSLTLIFSQNVSSQLSEILSRIFSHLYLLKHERR